MVLMDKASRYKLKLAPSEECDFTIREVGFWGELCWVWGATNPVYRIAGRLGVLSLVLGLAAFAPLVWDIATRAWAHPKAVCQPGATITSSIATEPAMATTGGINRQTQPGLKKR